MLHCVFSPPCFLFELKAAYQQRKWSVHKRTCFRSVWVTVRMTSLSVMCPTVLLRVNEPVWTSFFVFNRLSLRHHLHSESFLHCKPSSCASIRINHTHTHKVKHPHPKFNKRNERVETGRECVFFHHSSPSFLSWTDKLLIAAVTSPEIQFSLRSQVWSPAEPSPLL